MLEMGEVFAIGFEKSSAELISPQTARRHGGMLGSVTPKRFSMKRMDDVWSNTSEHTHPPLLHGEMISAGTRAPSP